MVLCDGAVSNHRSAWHILETTSTVPYIRCLTFALASAACRNAVCNRYAGARYRVLSEWARARLATLATLTPRVANMHGANQHWPISVFCLSVSAAFRMCIFAGHFFQLAGEFGDIVVCTIQPRRLDELCIVGVHAACVLRMCCMCAAYMLRMCCMCAACVLHV